MRIKITVTDDMPIAMLTVGQLKEALGISKAQPELIIPKRDEEKYVYGLPGLAKLFDCSITTANRIKQSGKIDKAIRQVGRKIIIDADLAIELASQD